MNKNYKFINLSYLNSMSGGSEEIIKEMIDIFLEQLPEFREGFKDAIEHNDAKRIGEVAHKAKSSMAILGIDGIQQRLAQLEQNVKEAKEEDTYISEAKYFLEVSKEIEDEVSSILK